MTGRDWACMRYDLRRRQKGFIAGHGRAPLARTSIVTPTDQDSSGPITTTFNALW